MKLKIKKQKYINLNSFIIKFLVLEISATQYLANVYSFITKGWIVLQLFVIKITMLALISQGGIISLGCLPPDDHKYSNTSDLMLHNNDRSLVILCFLCTY